MNKTTKRALDLLHNGYHPHNSAPHRRVFPKWRQACAIAKSEEFTFAAYCGARLLGTTSARPPRRRVYPAVRMPR